ncbi:MAG: phosphatidate cytidylyltransferase [Verrucomicrobia bacterium]|nr:phosphatidate cytidylyltransferase [Verrucomicrobiota bacterium]
MKQRFYSFTLLWFTIILALGFLGSHGAVLLVTLLALLTQLELYQLLEKMGQHPKKRLGICRGAGILLGGYYLPGLNSGIELFLLSYFILALVIACGDLRTGVLRNILPTLFGLTYVPFLLSYILLTVKDAESMGLGSQSGIYLGVWVIAVAKASDVGGLLVGMRFGKTPLSKISPAKTYEGAAGGILTSVLVGLAFQFFFRPNGLESFGYWHAALFAIPIAVAAIVSDLVESAFKREAGVKDSGSLIPGIGGVFDLSDSLILSAPLGYLLFKYTLFI